MNFFKRVLSTVVGIGVFFALCIIILIFFIFMSAGSNKDIVVVKSNSVLELNLDMPINDYAGKYDYGDLAFFPNEPRYDGLFNIIDAINYAATDSKINGISIKNNSIQAGMAQTKALRDALLAFKDSGKFIVSYGDYYSQKDYYLNSVADTIYVNPVGGLDFKGLAMERMYYKDFQEKYGVKMEVIRHGKYKSAVEGYLNQEMSEANREQISVFLQSIWDEMKKEIGASRNMTSEQLNTLADELAGRTAKLALTSKLIDKIGYEDEYEAGIQNALGANSDVNRITIYEYAEYVGKKSTVKKSEDKIAVIYAQGQIMYAEGDETFIGQGVINKALKEAREDDKVKAIVLRVNSPGGSALASELIWREIELTKKTKPVIVSMGDLAASGGYYIACNADKIFAEPNTITGSIGVFGTIPNMHKLAEDMGINAEQVGTNKNAAGYSVFEPMSDEQRALIKEGIEDIYDLFTQRVADGRGMTQTAVDSIAQGRVWTGNDAIKIGLVDEIGGLDMAIQAAADAAEMTDYKIKELPIYEKDLESILNQYTGGFIQTKEDILKEELGDKHYMMLQKMKKMTQMQGPQLLLPYEIEIK
ncbi:signal peptide peptidase SppA [Kordia sp. YSTF-M3]|uniref:Signal peptide peptidase SppA n=1 Tax=Kordia aestuariivivens TaxID=2759037 RepID=A0ABR7Q3M2_9FLAO|nr:signal peptide peptidase SppA [Kordia aestuariivivens]MBC8753151.1 signal peptide peptidase SppA [Kordia aestuariivivens]